MAFGFFRRRQKMVVIIMAVLMVSFLIGFQGFNMLFETDRADQALGQSRYGKITFRDVQGAESQIEILRRYIGVGSFDRFPLSIYPTDMEFLAMQMNNPGSQAPVAYALLLKEAGESGIRVLESEIDGFFAQIGRKIDSDEYRMMVANYKATQFGNEGQLRTVVANWLLVNKFYANQVAAVPPSDPELRKLFRELKEELKLGVASLKAEDYLDQVGEPTEEQVQEQFTLYRNRKPGDFSMDNSFGFGYYQPDRVQILSLFISEEPVRRVAKASEKDVLDYYRRNRSEFVKTPTAEGDQTAAASAEQMDFASARPAIEARLQAKVVKDKMDELMSNAEAMLAEASVAKAANKYAWVKTRMTGDASALLSGTIPALQIQNETIADAVKKLAKEAGVEAICFPYGKTAKANVDPNLRVSLVSRDMTLGEALKALAEQVKWDGDIQWATCVGFGKTLFPANEDIGLFPVSAAQTEMIDWMELRNDEILARSVTNSGQELWKTAFMTEGLSSAAQAGRGEVAVASEGPRMIVMGDEPGQTLGQLIWQVSAIEPAHAPEAMNEEIRQQVVKDLRTTAAFERAVQAAEALQAAAVEKGLEAAAMSAKKDFTVTDFFARKIMYSPQQQIAMLMLQGQLGTQVIPQMLMARPVVVDWSSIPGFQVPSSASMLRRDMMDTAFSLVPSTVEPAEGSVPYPVTPYALAVLNLPSMRQVLVFQRVDYRPAVEFEFQNDGKESLTMATVQLNRWLSRQMWFSFDAITQRADYRAGE